MEELAIILQRYGLETVLLALAINLCTALCKIPVKLLARKAKNSADITRFIVFMPIVLGFVLTLCYVKLCDRQIVFDNAFMRLWLTASSLSLTFYAVAEKIFVIKRKPEDVAATEASKELINAIAESEQASDVNGNSVPTVENKASQKIVLRGHKQNEIEK